MVSFFHPFQVPSELGLLTELKSLWIHMTGLTGELPIEICGLVQSGILVTLSVDCSKISCPPSCNCNCPTADTDMAVPTSNAALRTSSIRGSAAPGSKGQVEVSDRSIGNNGLTIDWSTPPKMAFERSNNYYDGDDSPRWTTNYSNHIGKQSIKDADLIDTLFTSGAKEGEQDSTGTP